MHHRSRLLEELSRAEAEGQNPLVFMHAYPGDLAVDGVMIARAMSDARVALVDTGHTHYNELLNDGRVIYGATRSTGQIEEDEGKPGFSIVCAHDRTPSWRFHKLGRPWPHVQIAAPCDLRLMTRPADPRQIPRSGRITIVARIFGATRSVSPVVRVDGASEEEMWLIDGLWTAKARIDEPGFHRIEVACGEARDRIDLLVRGSDNIPMRQPPIALGGDCNAIGAWSAAGLSGLQLGPNKNGRHW
jgi:hypothetical protein